MIILKLEKFKKSDVNILVVGDAMLDRYECGTVNRISPESPVPVFNYKKSYSRLGGAANVCLNLIDLCNKVELMSIVGDDYHGRELIGKLKHKNIDTDLVIRDASRPTTIKTRILAQNNQQLLRIDHEVNKDISSEIQRILLSKFKDIIINIDIVLITDYLKGMLTEEFLLEIINICNNYDKKVIIDVKDRNISKYRNAYLLKPNLKELEDILNIKISNNEELREAVLILKQISNCKVVLVTLGEEGMLLNDEKGNFLHLPSHAKDVYDVTGAGDTVLAFLGAAIGNNFTLEDSVRIANLAASIQVSKVGTDIVTLKEIEKLTIGNTSYENKIISLEMYDEIKDQLLNKDIVFTNGCFDILHIGHVKYLRKASELGDLLIVAVNSDASVKKLKGESRPINPERDRLEMLAQLDFIDFVILFDEDTPYNLIKAIMPKVLVKGADYTIEEVVGREIVESNGGHVKLIQLVEGISTTQIIEKISINKEVNV